MDLVPGETVTLSDTVVANSLSTYFWQFDDTPIGTSPILAGFNTASPTFVVDVDPLKCGSYRVRCTVDGVDISVEILAVPLANTGARIPSFQEETEYDKNGNAKGWHEAMTNFMRSVDAALGGGGGGPHALPEQWTQASIADGQADVVMSAQVSTGFDEIQAIRAGSIVGINARLAAALGALSDDVTVTVSINGTPGALSVNLVANDSSGRATQATGVDTYVAGDLIGILISTGAEIVPTGNSIESWLEVQE